MNIILVVFDSLRRDCVNAYGPAPWWPLQTPHFDAFAEESVIMTRAYPESLPTLPARRALYTGRRCYPFHNGDFRLKGDFVGAAGWGPIPEDQPTLAELLRKAGYRTGLVSDLYHMFKPSKNYWRGFDQWTFLRGQERDPERSGPDIPDAELKRWAGEFDSLLHRCECWNNDRWRQNGCGGSSQERAAIKCHGHECLAVATRSNG